MRNLVSVITPTYNCAGFIGETIESVIAQTYTDWEMIIVDDCSNDDTESVVGKYIESDQRIRYFRLENNSGAAVARTKAMHMANGEYMAFLDSDDLWKPEKLEKQLHFMKEKRCSFSCTSYEQINEHGDSIGKVIEAITKTSYNRLLLDCPVGNSTVMYSVAEMGKFDVPNIRKRNDDALWLKMLKCEPYIWGLKDILSEYRIRSDSISSDKLNLVRYHWELYRDIEHLSIPRSVFHVCAWGIIKIMHLK